MSSRFRAISGRLCAGSALVALCALAACNYGFRGGGGFPPHIRTMFIESFENETPQFELEQQVFNELLDRLPRALGVRPAGREVADAILTGRITRYDDLAQNYRPGEQGRNTEVLTHQVQITISATLLDTANNVILWRTQGLSGQGEYQPASETDQVGRAKAIERLIEQIVDKAQSQW